MKEQKPWLYFQHPDTLCVARVHRDDLGKIKVYIRWGWRG
jgi:hypothetical protein